MSKSKRKPSKPTNGALPPDAPLLISSAESAKLLGCAEATLRDARCRQTGFASDLPFLRFGHTIRYDYSVVVAWMRRHQVAT